MKKAFILFLFVVICLISCTPNTPPEVSAASPFRDAITHGAYATASVSSSIATQYGTLKGNYTVSFDEGGQASLLVYNYQQLNYATAENLGEPMTEEVTGRLSLTGGEPWGVASYVKPLAEMKINLDEDKLSDLTVADGILTAKVKAADTQAVIGYGLECDAQLEITLSYSSITQVQLKYTLPVGEATITCIYS
jgi:hypothetical protein